MIYAIENGNFKIKDSHGLKYDIPLNRPDFFQVISSDLKIFEKFFFSKAS